MANLNALAGMLGQSLNAPWAGASRYNGTGASYDPAHGAYGIGADGKLPTRTATPDEWAAMAAPRPAGAGDTPLFAMTDGNGNYREVYQDANGQQFTNAGVALDAQGRSYGVGANGALPTRLLNPGEWQGLNALQQRNPGQTDSAVFRATDGAGGAYDVFQDQQGNQFRAPSGTQQTTSMLFQLPDPRKIVGRNFLQMDPDTQQFILGAYQTPGAAGNWNAYSAADVTGAIQRGLPQFTAPSAGRIVNA